MVFDSKDGSLMVFDQPDASLTALSDLTDGRQKVLSAELNLKTVSPDRMV